MNRTEMAEKLQELWNECELALYRTASGENSKRYKDAAKEYHDFLVEYCKSENMDINDEMFALPTRKPL